MDTILADFQDLKRLVDISRSKGKGYIFEIHDKHDAAHQDRKDIAAVFAFFYEDLFKFRSIYKRWEECNGRSWY